MTSLAASMIIDHNETQSVFISFLNLLSTLVDCGLDPTYFDEVDAGCPELRSGRQVWHLHHQGVKGVATLDRCHVQRND